MRTTEVRTSVVVARRLLASVVITPAVAGMYVLIYTLLVLAGAEATATLSGVIANGLVLGASASIVFCLSALVKK